MLVVGGFTQPVVAKALIEMSASIEKGLTQRFLWLSPKPSYSKYSSLVMRTSPHILVSFRICLSTLLKDKDRKFYIYICVTLYEKINHSQIFMKSAFSV